METITYNIQSLEAYGSKKEGWELNQWYDKGEIELSEAHTDIDIIQALIDADCLIPTAKKKVYCDRYNCESDYTCIRCKKTDQPLYSIEIKQV
jgi:hypothetical protein